MHASAYLQSGARPEEIERTLNIIADVFGHVRVATRVSSLRLYEHTHTRTHSHE